MYRTAGLWAAATTVFRPGVMAVRWAMSPGMAAPPSRPSPDCYKVVADVLKDLAGAEETGRVMDYAIPAECTGEAGSAGLRPSP
ncbi:hypothetical protein [Streptomyces sp. Wb2n-11]|uniref:hypothetical protein n=1 Tax=Streptomyces sp. Wb2n-11 TaxID=1030533 RepID=UPI000A5E7894|nr:hypothetical protein [Streptomyces sp. Wb2n-11]